ncbi:MAG: hypothetical protein GKR87_02265 [Kiritimatiellae bacterium]|nr:hypothetical protein [Kiritimatiellia bacterium]
MKVEEKIIKNKVRFSNLAKELGNVSHPYKIMGFSRHPFYRYKAAANEGGVEAFFEENFRKPNLKNRVTVRSSHEHYILIGSDDSVPLLFAVEKMTKAFLKMSMSWFEVQKHPLKD